MVKTTLNIPPNIGYLSDWRDFDSCLPSGKIIVNKVLCGCGMTHYYLTNPTPVILISPRKNLILSKVNDTKLPHIHYFDRGNPKVDLQESIDRLKTYLNNPLPQGFAHKIMVTYDSFPKVEEILQQRRDLSRFTLVVDEFSCLFTDARLKGMTDLKLLRSVIDLPNRVVFISATPIKEFYLDEMSEFQNMTYVTLVWDPSLVRTISLKYESMRSTKSAIRKIIEDFKKVGYFQKKLVAGHPVRSVESVFFLNSLTDIVGIVKTNGLTDKDTRVVCADTDDNKKLLKKVGLGIERFPSRQYYQQENKTFTFVTRACFEGSDLYSDSATTYVFADSNRENLSLDISIDLTQIIGRCRTMTNPFVNDVYYYFKTTDKSKFDYKVQCDLIENRRNTTEQYLSTNPQTLTPTVCRKFMNAQKSENYKDDYIEVIQDSTGHGHTIFNKLVFLSDIRALEIKNYQYKNPQTLLLYLSDNGFSLNGCSACSTDPYDKFLNAFNIEPKFEVKLKMLFDVIFNDPYLAQRIQQDPTFPEDFKKFVYTLGSTICTQLNFNEGKIRAALDFREKKPAILTAARSLFMIGQSYTKEVVKHSLQGIYNSLGISRKAKANQILELFPLATEVNITDNNGKRQKGYKI